MLVRLCLILAFLAAPASAQQRVWFVAQGFEFGHHDQIQAAVDAAAEGDLIVVRPGHYAPFTIAGKGLTVVAEDPRSVWVTALSGHAIEVRDLGAAQSVVLRDLVALRGGNDSAATVSVHDAAGEVRFEGVLAGHDVGEFGQASLAVDQCASFTAVESGFAQGVVTLDSSAWFVDCHLQGSQGKACTAGASATPGGIGLEVHSGTVLLADSVVRGGQGGAGDLGVGCCNAAGGAGLRLGLGSPQLTRRETSILAGGPGGGQTCAGGTPSLDIQSGTITTEAGATPTGGFAREWAQTGTRSAVVARADAGQALTIGFSLGTTQLPTPLALGDLLIAPPFLLVAPLGASDGFETGVGLQAPYVPPGLPPIDLFAQTLASDPLNGPVLGVRDAVRVLDLATAIAGDADCNANGLLDTWELELGLATDDDRNGVLDACEAHPIVHVDDNAPGDPGPFDASVSDPLEDGSAAHPFDSIQEAIAAAPAPFAIVQLAAGTYKGDGNRNVAIAGRRLVVQGPGTQAAIEVQSFGRAFHVTAGSEVVFRNLKLAGGDVGGASGGALWIQDSTVLVERCFLVANTAVYGGAIDAENSDLVVRDAFFSANYATDDGGAIRELTPVVTSAGQLVGRTPGMRIARTRFSSNLGDVRGGAIWSKGRVIGPRLKSASIQHSSSGFGGGGLYLASAGAVLESVNLSGNSTGGSGAGLEAVPTGGLFDWPPLVRQSTLRGNDAYFGGGAVHAFAAELHGSIVHGNTAVMPGEPQYAFGPDWVASGALAGAFETPELFVRDSLFEGGPATLVPGPGTAVLWGPNNIDANPLFASPFKHTADLQSSSPAIDTGGATWVAPLLATDFESDPRLKGAGYDRGADEF